MDLLRPVKVFDKYQQRHAPLAIPMAVIKKFGDDQAGSLAALVAYYAFFSIFPLLLVFVTVLGFVLQGDAHAQQSLADSPVGKFPIIGDQIKSVHGLSGHVGALVIGVLTSLWAGLGITQAAQNALDRVWAVPFKDRPDFIHSRLRGLGLFGLLGLVFIVATAASGVVTSGLGGTWVAIGGYVSSLIFNFAVLLVAFRMLTSATVATRCLWIGVGVAAVLWELLQVLGSYYVKHVIAHASNTYGVFATVIGLLAWLHLGAQLTIYAAEINVVLTRKLWPRSLFGPAVQADEETLTALAKVEERDDREKVDVHFER